MKSRKRLALCFLAVAWCANGPIAFERAYAEEPLEFFERKVRPLLEARCFECHSQAHDINGGLRLDFRQGWEQGGDSGPAIVPGKPEESLLMSAVKWTDPDTAMPPENKLTDQEIAILETWVRMGAPDPRTGAIEKKQIGMSIEEGRAFWSYSPRGNPAPPPVNNQQWPRGSIDRFVLNKLEEQGLTPSPMASPEVLVRRLFYVLNGVPPSAEQIDEFVRQFRSDPFDAMQRMVDTLLASPQFGEAWGRHWLDVARFSESSGGGRTLLFKDSWRYRDYVIDAFNRDLPLDQFIREQLAGDLLPTESIESARSKITATAFLTLGPTNYEEQDKKQLRFDIIDEQLDTLGRAFMAQTLGCARCHDHKFDPISQSDYYAMAGIFASTRTLHNQTDNVARWIVLPLPQPPQQEAALLAHEIICSNTRKEIATAKAMVTELSKNVSAEITGAGKPIDPQSLPGIVIDQADEPGSRKVTVVGEWTHSTSVMSYVGSGYLHDGNTGKGEKTITFVPVIPKAGRYEVRLAYTHGTNRATNVPVTLLHADGEEDKVVDESKVPPIDGRFVSLGTYRFEKDGAGYVLIGTAQTDGHVIVDALQLIAEGDESSLPDMPDAAQSDQTQQAQHLHRAAVTRVAQLEKELKQLEKSGPLREMTMAVCEADQMEDTALRVRGIEKNCGPLVPRGFMQVVSDQTPSIPPGQSGRKELAEWIVSSSNPLTARVMVNRLWAWSFGAGLVRTVDNFGSTGEMPSHPELLDFLANRLIDQGWSTKKLLREMILTSTWSQMVAPPLSSDPDNRLLSHAFRRRLDAEQIRDSMLMVSGTLDLTLGGSNIAGAGDIDANDFSAQNIEYGYTYADSRRSVYTPAFRNKRLELFEVFDFGDINSSIGQRHVSTVAPQALFLMNHPFVIEQSRLAAERFLAIAPDDSSRLSAAFRATLGREPTGFENRRCLEFLSTFPPDRVEGWAAMQQTLFGCIDFRYLE